jgi:Zn-dependent protease with chaperone function
VTAKSDRALFWLLLATALPAGAVVFALTRAAHDLRVILAAAPEPIAGLCREAVSYTISPLAHASYVGFGTLAAVSTGLGGASLALSYCRTRRRLKRELQQIQPPPPRLRAVAERAGLRRLLVIHAEEPRAFTFGLLWPAVAVSSSLVRCLADDEMEAILRHEAAHVRRRDPLRMLVVGSLARAFVFAPILRELARRFQAAKEIDADEDVIMAMGSRRPLVSALLRVEEIRPAGAMPSFAGISDARLASLEGEEPFPRQQRRLLAASISLVTLLGIAAGLFVITTGMIDPHALHICSG